MIKNVSPEKRNLLISLFKECKYDRVLIDSVLEGKFGEAYINSDDDKNLARLDSGAFTILAGDPESTDLHEIIDLAPIYFVTPQNKEWENKHSGTFKSKFEKLSFTEYKSDSIDPQKLEKYIDNLSKDYELKRVDKNLAKRITTEIGNEYFFENYHSINDFLSRGIAYCILHNDKIVSAASSMAQSSTAIDIEIETVSNYQRQGLGTIVGASLVLYCLENAIEAKWLAANVESEKLAEKLGYIKGDTYYTYQISD